MEPRSMEYFSAQVQQKDVGGRQQVGQELLQYLGVPGAIPDLEEDVGSLGRTIDALTGWVGSSNYRISLMGLEILSAFVDRLSTRFKSYVAMVIVTLVDRLGDAKDKIRDEAQILLLKLMDQVAPPMHIWEQLASGFKHKNFRSREGVCLCLIETLNIFGAQPLVLSKLVPHLCILFGDSNSQVRDAAILAIVEIYRHVGEKVRVDLSKRGIPPARLETIFAKFDEVQNSGGMILSVCKDKSFDDEESVDGNRPSSAASAFKVPAPKTSGNPVNSARKPGSSGGPKVGGASKEGGAGAVDEEDFIKAFTDVPPIQIYSGRELEETLNKIREILSDDKHDWDQRANALKKIRSLLVAGAAQYDCFFQHLLAELLKELSNHNERVEERKIALYELMKLTQEESFSVWDEHFKTILLLLLETLGDKEPTIRALALKVLKEILRHQPARFKNYAELTVMKTLEAHKDPHKEVVRSAEEAASVLATSISPEQCIKVLCPIIQTADYPINLAAIKMQTKVIERVSKETLNLLLPEIMPGLIQGYDNSESSVRKACVFCLVAVHAVIGDELKPHLSQLTGSKMKLLNLYIKRAQTGSGGADPTTDVPGQS
uniref:Cytoplasmic linker associated protein 2 n=1 Tax=Pipistrellus kuhlii TaxID=59472 RepID=A0A7J7WC57_PIPKU|nr:cytoplasmic linker associated protein 2 [Pipistrellus kuhlii]